MLQLYFYVGVGDSKGRVGAVLRWPSVHNDTVIPDYLFSRNQLRDNNVLVTLERKFWEEDVKKIVSNCTDDSEDVISDTALKPENMTGVFLVLGTLTTE